MTLIDNARDVILKAWSIRFILLAGALTGIEVILPQLAEFFPPKTFTILSGLCTFAALVARVVAQPASLPKGADGA
jgi:hypothetical protein